MALDCTWVSKAGPLVLTVDYQIYPGDLVTAAGPTLVHLAQYMTMESEKVSFGKLPSETDATENQSLQLLKL